MRLTIVCLALAGFGGIVGCSRAVQESPQETSGTPATSTTQHAAAEHRPSGALAHRQSAAAAARSTASAAESRAAAHSGGQARSSAAAVRPAAADLHQAVPVGPELERKASESLNSQAHPDQASASREQAQARADASPAESRATASQALQAVPVTPESHRLGQPAEENEPDADADLEK